MRFRQLAARQVVREKFEDKDFDECKKALLRSLLSRMPDDLPHRFCEWLWILYNTGIPLQQVTKHTRIEIPRFIFEVHKLALRSGFLNIDVAAPIAICLDGDTNAEGERVVE